MSIVIKDAELEMEFAMGLFEGICLDFANEPAVDVDETIAEYAFRLDDREVLRGNALELLAARGRKPPFLFLYFSFFLRV